MEKHENIPVASVARLTHAKNAKYPLVWFCTLPMNVDVPPWQATRARPSRPFLHYFSSPLKGFATQKYAFLKITIN